MYVQRGRWTKKSRGIYAREAFRSLACISPTRGWTSSWYRQLGRQAGFWRSRKTYMVVPTPFHNPRIPASARTAASSVQNPLTRLSPAASLGRVNVTPPPLAPRPESTATLSPQIPAHLLGFKHPLGASRRSDDGAMRDCDAGRSDVVAQIKGLGWRVVIDGERMDVWQHSAATSLTARRGWCVCRRVLSTSNGVTTWINAAGHNKRQALVAWESTEKTTH